MKSGVWVNGTEGTKSLWLIFMETDVSNTDVIISTPFYYPIRSWYVCKIKVYKFYDLCFL